MPTAQDDCTDAGGTHPWMDAVERRREQPSRATQEQLPSSCRRLSRYFVQYAVMLR